jgi:hypothetical protein
MTAPLTLTSFLGQASVVDPKLLPETTGVLSLNQRPGRGDLRPWYQPLEEATVPTGAQRLSLYRMAGGYWFSWTTVVNAVKGFETDDTTERFYFTGSGTPKWSDNVMGLSGGPPYPQAARELAVPAPTTVLTATETVTGTGDTAEWFYVQTFVNDIGWESAPGPVSVMVTVPTDSTIAVGNLDSAPSGNYGITLTRIYKAVSGASGTAAFFFLAEHTIGTTVVTDSGQTVGEELATGANGVGGSWQPPPADGFGLTAMWNGMLAICSGNSVYINEPYTPYAYPLRYRIDVADKVVGLAVYGQTMLILTAGDTYLVSGSDPASLECIAQKIMQPCVSAQSIVAFEDCVLWATASGLWYFGSRGSFCITTAVMDARQWAVLAPASMMASRHANLRLLFVFYSNGSRKGFALDIDSPASLYGLSQGYNALCRAATGDMYVLTGGSVQKWDASAALMLAEFKSKPFQMPAPIAMGALEVVASDYPVHVRIVAANRGISYVIIDRNVTSQDATRTAPGMFEEYSIEVTTSVGSVQALRLAQSEDDLRNG